MSDPRESVDPMPEMTSAAEHSISPLVQLRDGVLGCEFCGSTSFRRSRVRVADVGEILRLQYPLRCMRCGQRHFFDVALAFLSTRLKARGPRVARDRESWQTWTQSTPETPLSTRPMTTAVGTRAQRLAKPMDAEEPATQSQESRSRDGEAW